jgi:hypothetical protein
MNVQTLEADFARKTFKLVEARPWTENDPEL